MDNKPFQHNKKEFKKSNPKSLDNKVSKKSINSVKDKNINNRKSEIPINSSLTKEKNNIYRTTEIKNNTKKFSKNESDKSQTTSSTKSPMQNPDIAKPDTAKPDTAKSDIAKPDTAKSDIAKPDIAKQSAVTEAKKEIVDIDKTHNKSISSTNAVANKKNYSTYSKASISYKYKKTNLVKNQSNTLKDRLKNKKITIAKVRLIKPKSEFSNKTYPAKARLAKKFAFKNEINSLTQKNKKKKSSKSNALKTNLKINQNETSESGAEAIKLAGQTYDYAVTGVKIGKRVALSPIRVPSKIIAKVKSINRAKRIKLAKKTIKSEIKSIKSEIKNIKDNTNNITNYKQKFKLTKLSKPIKIKIENNPQRLTYIRNNAKKIFSPTGKIGKNVRLGSLTAPKYSNTKAIRKLGEIFKLKHLKKPMKVKISNPQRLLYIRYKAKNLFKSSAKLGKRIALISLKKAIKLPISVVDKVKKSKLKSKSKSKTTGNFKLKKLDKSFKVKKTIIKKQLPKKDNAEKIVSLKKRLKAKKKVLRKLNSAKGREGRLIVVGFAKKTMSTAFAQVGQKFTSQRIDVNNTGDSGIQAVKLMGQTVDYARTVVTTPIKVIKAPIKLTKNTVKTVKTLRQAPKNIKNTYRSVKKSVKIVKKATRTTYNLTKETIKLSYRVGQFAAKVVLKIAIQAAQIASKAIVAIVSNPYVLAVVAAAVLVFILIVTVSNGAGAITASVSGTLDGTIGWLLNSDTTDDGVRSEYADNETRSIEKWHEYVENIINEYNTDEVYIDLDFFTNLEKLDYFSTLYTKKLKNSPDLTIESIELSDSEIYDFFSEYLEYTEQIGVHYINGVRLTYVVITFSLNNDVMDDLEFTDEDKQRVDDIKIILGDILV